MYSLSDGTRSSDQAAVRANHIHVPVPVGKGSQVSLINITNSNDKHLDAITPELRRKPTDEVGGSCSLLAADYHHQDLSDEREHLPPCEEISETSL